MPGHTKKEKPFPSHDLPRPTQIPSPSPVHPSLHPYHGLDQNATPTAPGLGIPIPIPKLRLFIPTSIALLSMPRRRFACGLCGGFKSFRLRPLFSATSTWISFSRTSGLGTRFDFVPLVCGCGCSVVVGEVERDDAENNVTVALSSESVRA